MATKELMTRIALKYDSYANWTNETVANQGANLKLLKGEIGICEIPAANGASNVAPTVLFKVGAYKKDASGNDTTELMTFKELPWASAKAADVYGWAKSETVTLAEVEEGTGDAKVKKQYLQFKTGTNVNYSVDLSSFATDAELLEATNRIQAIEDALGLEGGENTIKSQLDDINDSLEDILGTEEKTGLIDAAVAGIEAKLGGNFGTGEGQKTVAKAIEDAQSAAEGHADEAIAALSEKDGAIFELDSRVDALEDRVDLESGETVKGVVAAAINDLDSVDAGDTSDNSIVKSVSQTDGKVTVTYGKLTRDELPELVEEDIPEIHANKVIVADATTDGEGKPVAKVTLDAKLTTIDGDIKSLRDSIAGGVHFIGTIGKDAEFPTNVNQGDIVIKGTQEYIYNGTTWEPLGDVTRIGAVEERVDNIEEAIAAMDADLDAAANEFVTGIVQVDGKITKIDTARPTAENVKYGTKTVEGVETDVTVKAKIDELANEIDAVEDRADKLETKVNLAEGETVTGVIGDAINEALDALDFADTEATGAGKFVKTVTQTNGQIAVVKAEIESADLPAATASAKGAVTLGASGGAATYDAVNELVTTTIPGITDRVDDVEEQYVRVDNGMLVQGKEGTQMIIFNCGSATEVI